MGAELVDAREVCSAYVVNAPFARQQGSEIFATNVVAFRLMARVKATSTIPRGTVALRKTLLESGVLRERGYYMVFTSDYRFSSPSATAATVIGASSLCPAFERALVTPAADMPSPDRVSRHNLPVMRQSQLPFAARSLPRPRVLDPPDCTPRPAGKFPARGLQN